MPFIERYKNFKSCCSDEFDAIIKAALLQCIASCQILHHFRKTPSHTLLWDAISNKINPKQRRTLLTRSALLEQLVLRLMNYNGVCYVKHPQHRAKNIISQNHFVGSKNYERLLFQEGQLLYGQRRYRDAAKSWGQAVLLQHLESHAYLTVLLFEMNHFQDGDVAHNMAAAGAAMGCPHSKGAQALCLMEYGYCHGDLQSKKKGLELAEESAAAGSCFGQFAVGWCYYQGRGVKPDYTKAVLFWRLAEAQGYAYAQFNLGTMFEKGKGVERNYTEAVRLYRLAAVQGHVSAQNNLGTMLSLGLGVVRDFAEAARWRRLAQEYHSAARQCNLNDLFR